MISLLFAVFFIQAEERVSIPFEHQVETCLPMETVWDDLSRALVDSNTSRLWPNRRSQVKGPPTIELGAHVHVTYRLSLFSRTYGYMISEFEPGQRITYTADQDHPFIGGATILFGPQGLLRWQGEYQVEASDRTGRRFFESFRENFFRDLNENIRRFETDVCPTRRD